MDIKTQRQELTDIQIGYTVGASDGGISQREIAHRLNCNQSIISRLTKDIIIDALTPKCPGPSRRTSDQDDRLFVRTTIRKRMNTLQDITNTVNTPVSRQIISRRLNETDVKSYTTRQKPFLKPEHIMTRLEWTLEHQD
jgi:transcriptional regulator